MLWSCGALAPTYAAATLGGFLISAASPMAVASAGAPLRRQSIAAEWAATPPIPSPFVVGMVGNNTGVYSAPAITASNILLLGFAFGAGNMGATSFNFEAAPFGLIPDQVNASAGWRAGLGQITDPTATDWTGYYLIWLYK